MQPAGESPANMEPRAGRNKPATSLNSPGGGALFSSAGAFPPFRQRHSGVAVSAAWAERLRLQDASAQMPRMALHGGKPTNRHAALNPKGAA